MLISILFTVLMLILCNTAGGAWIGVAIECSLSDKGIKRGVKVIGVDADGPGARTGLRVGDLVVLVNGETVETCSSLAKIVREASIGTCLKMIIWRKSEWVSIELILAARPQHFIFNQQGWEQTEKGNYEEAIRYFTKAIDLNPMDAEFYYNRGTAYLNKDQYDQAISDYKKALEINPMDANAYYNRGIAYFKKSQYDQAILDFSKASAINPMDANAYYNRGIIYCKKGQHDQAISDFKNAFEINPNNSRYLAVYVDHEIAYYENMGQYDQAISDYKKALEINPMDAKAYYKRGLAYYYKKKYHKSWEDVNKAQILGLTIPKHILEKLYKALER